MKYRLLKDMPGYEAGEVFEKRGTSFYRVGIKDGLWAYMEMILNAVEDPDCSIDGKGWFEPIPDVPEYIVERVVDDRSPFHGYNESIKVHFNAEIFAARVVEEAIDSLMAYILIPDPPEGQSRTSIGGAHNAMNHVAMKARIAIHGDRND